MTSESPRRTPLEQAIVELQGLHKILLAGDLDPRVLTDFGDALNRVRTAAWADHQRPPTQEEKGVLRATSTVVSIATVLPSFFAGFHLQFRAVWRAAGSNLESEWIAGSMKLPYLSRVKVHRTLYAIYFLDIVCAATMTLARNPVTHFVFAL